MLNQPSTNRIIALSFATCGLYIYFWCAKSAQAVNSSLKQNQIPSNWLLLIPLFRYWWVWQYATGLQAASFNRIQRSEVFMLFMLAVFVASPAWIYEFTPQSVIDHIFEKPLLVGLTIFLIPLVAYSIFVSGFFCATVQRKINLSINQPKQ